MNLREITDRVYDGLKQNNFRTLGLPEEVMFDRPLIGVAAGDDPYFTFLKEHIGPFHWTPAEAFALKFGQADPASLRVISMVFPQSARTKEAQKQARNRVEEARRQGEAKAREQMTEAERRAAEVTREVLEQAEKDCELQKEAARQRLDQAAQLIIEKVVKR